MPFDIQGARAAGYSDAEIADELAKDTKFDTAGARAAGYSDAEIINELQPPKPPATAGDRLQAVTSGVNSGLASTIGLPVDTGLNALDVGKALIGAGYLGADAISRKLGGDGVDIPAFIRPTPRKNVIGSSENIKAGLNALGVDTAPVRPDDAASKYLNLGSNFLSGAYFGGAYGKLGIPSGITPRPGAVPPAAEPAGTPAGGRPGAPPPENFAGADAPLGGVPPRTPPPAPAPGTPGGPPLPPAVGLNSTEQATLAAGERLGMKITPGARAGSPQLRQIEARLESQPATSGPFEAIKANNAKIVQQQLLRAIGEQGDEVSSEALARASDRIGKVFDEAAANNKVAYDDALQSSLADIGSRATAELTEAEAPLIQRQLNEIVNKAASTGGVIEGPAFQNIYSALGRLSKNGTGSVKDLAGDVRDALHEALIRSAGPKAADNLRTARDQYRVLITAEKSGAIDPGSGTLRAGQLAGAFARSDKGGYLRGYNESGLYDALRFANTRTFGPIVGNSGTATRLGGFPDSLYRAAANAAGNLATRAYINTPASPLEGAVRATNATNQAANGILSAAKGQAIPAITGLTATNVFLDPGSTPEQAALAKSTISKTDPASYRTMVRDFLVDSYANPNSVAKDPRRIKAVLPADAPDALKELIAATQALSNNGQERSKGAITDALRQRSIGNLQFLLTPGQADPQTTGAGLDSLTDVLIDPVKRLQLRQATRIKDPEKQLLILGSIFNADNAQAALQ